ncbi:MAG TPA: hypothetical protein VIO64_17930 [Pseudobacteroides sp.]|uniref:hypothetical protein n=1 Tax=Pseudobacteroides sp. TaxID=1968840 RepID=UPI002F928C29
MARPKDSYIIEVHYPQSKGELIELRRRMGKAYIEFISDYILGLPICDGEKNKLYLKIVNELKNTGKKVV